MPKTKHLLLAIVAMGLAWNYRLESETVSESGAEEQAIRETALDYIEGWYEGNGDRMERALHPELVKRIVRADEHGEGHLESMGATALVERTKAGGGSQMPKAKQKKDIVILDVFGNTAAVKITAAGWVDYLHLAKYNGRWVIVNVLWELNPKLP